MTRCATEGFPLRRRCGASPGLLTIGLTQGVPPAHLAGVLRRFTVERPHIRLRIRETSIADALAQGTIQPALTCGFEPPGRPGQISAVPLAEESVAVARWSRRA